MLKCMKKIGISALVIMSILINMISVSAENKAYTLSDGAMVLNGLGILSSTADDIMTSKLTRGEAAQIIYNIVKYGYEEKGNGFNNSAWKDDFFGELSQDLKTPPESTKSEFSDIHENNEYYNAITFVSSVGLMSKDENGSFNAENEVQYIDAVKILADLMNYSKLAQLYGGYPKGYEKLSSQFGLNFSVKYDDTITTDDFARMVYKCFDIKIANIEYTTGNMFKVTYDDDKTFLSELLGLNVVRGRLTDNGISSLIDESTIGEKNIAVDDKILGVKDGCEYIRNYLGYEIGCYYMNDKHDNSPIAVYAHPTSGNGTVSFSIEDFKSITKSEITYDGNNGREKKIKLEQGYKAVINGMAENSVSNSSFDFDYGTITIVENKSGKNDLILVEGYKSCFIQNVDKTNNIIYNKAAKDKTGSAIKLNDYDYITITDAEGNKRNTAELNANAVIDVARTKNSIKIIICSESTSITPISVDKDEMAINTEDLEYKVTKSFLNSYNTLTIKTGTLYNVYLNNNGQIAWLEEKGQSSWIAAYLSNSWLDESGSDCYIKVYTELGELTSYKLSEKTRIIDETDFESNYSPDKAYQKIKGKYGLIRIKEYDDTVKQIELPLSKASLAKSNDRLFKMYANDDVWTNGISFDKNAFWSSNSIILSIPSDKSNEKGYSIKKPSKVFTNTTKHNVEAYGIDKNSKASKYFITLASSKTELDENTPAFVISDITEAYDEDENEVYYSVKGLKTNENNITEIKISLKSGLMDGIKSPIQIQTDTYKLEKGDVIRYTVDGDGWVDYAELIFDANGTNPVFPTGIKGCLCGSDGKAPTDNSRVGNPYGVTFNGTIGSIQYTQNSGMRIMYGYVLHYKDDIITLTTQDVLNNGYDESEDESGNTYTESYVFNPVSVAYINYDEKTYAPYKANKNIIKDYMNYPSCSRALFLVNYGMVRVAVIMDGEAK